MLCYFTKTIIPLALMTSESIAHEAKGSRNNCEVITFDNHICNTTKKNILTMDTHLQSILQG